MSAQANAVGVTNAHAGRDDVVHHAWELIDGVDHDRAAGGEAAADHLEIGNRAGAVVGPHHVGKLAEDAIDIQAVRLDCAVGKQVEAQVGVVRIGRGFVQILDGGFHSDAGHAALFIRTNEFGELLRSLLQALGAAGIYRGIEVDCWKPDVQDGAVVGNGCQAACGSSSHSVTP